MVDQSALVQELDSLRKKVELLKDKEQIRELLSRYSFNVDLRRIDNILRLWTDDCFFVTDAPGHITEVKGKDQFRSFFGNPPQQFRPDPQHLQLDYVVEVNGDTATAIGYQVITVPRVGGFIITRCGFRSFSLRRAGGKWLIQQIKSIGMTNESECQNLIPNEY